MDESPCETWAHGAERTDSNLQNYGVEVVVPARHGYNAPACSVTLDQLPVHHGSVCWERGQTYKMSGIALPCKREITHSHTAIQRRGY
jgi:hypothetical protein